MPMTETAALPPTSYFVSGELTSPKFAQAFARGCGGQVSNVLGALQPGPFAAFCTPAVWPQLARAKAANRDVYYGDHAYYGRGRYYRITKNGVQYQPTRAAVLRTSARRALDVGVHAVPNWRAPGRSVIICPNSDVYMRQWAGQSAAEWTAGVVETLRAHTDRPLVVRMKKHTPRPLRQDLADAWAVVVFSSNSAVEALCYGVPVFVLAPWASTARMGLADLTKIESPIYPDDRRLFCWHLADHQWTLDEIATGLAWRTLNAE